MQEKDMISDYLAELNASLATYANVIAQAENEQLRQTIQQMRDADEVRQYTIFNIAKQKGYYKPAKPATQEEITAVKTELTQG